jgi:hypothetical protein
MALGRPVVATGWSGNMDFMRGPGTYAAPFALVPAHDPQDTYACLARAGRGRISRRRRRYWPPCPADAVRCSRGSFPCQTMPVFLDLRRARRHRRNRRTSGTTRRDRVRRSLTCRRYGSLFARVIHHDLPVMRDDLPVMLQDGKPVFVGNRQPAIKSWFEDALERTARFEPVL